MPEKTDTTGIELNPKGEYHLSVNKVIKKSIGKEGGTQYPGYEWDFHIEFSDADPEKTDFRLFMFKSQMGDLLKALGCKEVKEGVYEWELDSVNGKTISCHLAHVDVSGKLREQLIEVKGVENKPQDTPNDQPEVWDE